MQNHTRIGSSLSTFVVVVSAADVVIVIDDVIKPIHCFDYDYDNDNEGSPGLNYLSFPLDGCIRKSSQKLLPAQACDTSA